MHKEALKKPASHRDNAFVNHTTLYHRGEEDTVEFKLERLNTYSKPVERQVCEGVEIHNDNSEIVMNSKLDHHLPAVS